MFLATVAGIGATSLFWRVTIEMVTHLFYVVKG